MRRSRISRREITAAMVLLPLAGCNPARRSERQPAELEPSRNTAPAKAPGTLVELITLNPDIRLDIRYATPNNFTGSQLYDVARAFLVNETAQALLRAQASAWADGFGLLIHDAYRPWRVTKKLWDATPPDKRSFVANPKEGSRHNRGCAVDLTLYDRNTGNALPMPSGYDEFSKRAYRNYAGGNAAETANRARLERYMEAEGFLGISNEWWHFDYKDWAQYPILDIPFSEI
jgi:zinc D-Ala-D-Ala dipeptidase